MTGVLSMRNGYLGWTEAAAFSGLGVTTLRRLVRQGRLKAYRPTVGRTLLSVRELVEVIESGEQPQPPPPAA